MNGVELEGLLAYRADVKQLFLRDHLSWRAIKVSGSIIFARQGSLLLITSVSAVVTIAKIFAKNLILSSVSEIVHWICGPN